MSYTAQQTTTQSLSGVMSLTDGVLTIEDGNISGVANMDISILTAETMDVSNGTIHNLTVENSFASPTANITNLTSDTALINQLTTTSTITAPSAEFTTLNASTFTSDTSNITTLNNTGLGTFNKIIADTIEVMNIQLTSVTYEILKLKKMLSNRIVTYTIASEHLMSNRLRSKNAEINSLTLKDGGMCNFMPCGTMIHMYGQTFVSYPCWVLCDGRWLKVSEFQNLYSVIGKTYGYRITNGYPEFKLFQSQGLFLRSYQGPSGATNNYYDGSTAYNKAPTDGPQKDNIRSHTHNTTMLYNEAFAKQAPGTAASPNGLTNIQNYTSGSLNQTQTSTTYTDNKSKIATETDETYPMYIGAYLYIKS